MYTSTEPVGCEGPCAAVGVGRPGTAQGVDHQLATQGFVEVLHAGQRASDAQPFHDPPLLNTVIRFLPKFLHHKFRCNGPRSPRETLRHVRKEQEELALFLLLQDLQQSPVDHSRIILSPDVCNGVLGGSMCGIVDRWSDDSACFPCGWCWRIQIPVDTFWKFDSYFRMHP